PRARRPLAVRPAIAPGLRRRVQLEDRPAPQTARGAHPDTEDAHLHLSEARRSPRLRHRDDDADGLAGADVQQPDDVVGQPRTHATHSNAYAKHTPTAIKCRPSPSALPPPQAPCGLPARAAVYAPQP